MSPYIYELPGWPRFTWSAEKLQKPLAAARNHQGFFLGTMRGLGFAVKQEAMLASMTTEIVKSSEIEGESLPPNQVRSSIARKLGLEAAGLGREPRKIEGVVEMTLDAVKSRAEPLTRERLFAWHRNLFEGSGEKFPIGGWRDDAEGPMQVVSGAIGSYKVHYEAPPAAKLEGEMRRFLEWESGESEMDPVLKAGLAHLWFVTVHPFGDGNGRIGRAITERGLARSEGGEQRFYSLSSQIMQERSAYYDALELAQKDSLDVTDWLEWFIGCFDRALTSSQSLLSNVLKRDAFWRKYAPAPLNARQKEMITRLIDGFDGKLTSTKWAKIMKCSQDTAGRDIGHLVELGILAKDAAGGRSTSYSLAPIEL